MLDPGDRGRPRQPRGCAMIDSVVQIPRYTSAVGDAGEIDNRVRPVEDGSPVKLLAQIRMSSDLYVIREACPPGVATSCDDRKLAFAQRRDDRAPGKARSSGYE